MEYLFLGTIALICVVASVQSHYDSIKSSTFYFIFTSLIIGFMYEAVFPDSLSYFSILFVFPSFGAIFGTVYSGLRVALDQHADVTPIVDRTTSSPQPQRKTGGQAEGATRGFAGSGYQGHDFGFGGDTEKPGFSTRRKADDSGTTSKRQQSHRTQAGARTGASGGQERQHKTDYPNTGGQQQQRSAKSRAKDVPRGNRHPDDAKFWAILDDPASPLGERENALRHIHKREQTRRANEKPKGPDLPIT